MNLTLTVTVSCSLWALDFGPAAANPMQLSIPSIKENSTFQDLAGRFPKLKVGDLFVNQGEGSCVKGTVFGSGTDSEFSVIWRDAARTEVSKVVFAGKLWTTLSGIQFGSSLKEIEKANGSEFSLTGFNWDYPGTIVNFGPKGKMKKDKLFIRLDTKKNDKKIISQKNKVAGDRIFSSSHPSMQALNPRVYSLELHFSETKLASVSCP